jgi:hypothetical protein
MYLLFCWPDYEAGGGVNDLVPGHFGTVLEARDHYKKLLSDYRKPCPIRGARQVGVGALENYQIVNKNTMTIVEQGEFCSSKLYE